MSIFRGIFFNRTDDKVIIEKWRHFYDHKRRTIPWETKHRLKFKLHLMLPDFQSNPNSRIGMGFWSRSFDQPSHVRKNK